MHKLLKHGENIFIPIHSAIVDSHMRRHLPFSCIMLLIISTLFLCFLDLSSHSFLQAPSNVVAIKAITKKNLAKSQNLLGKEIKILKVRWFKL